MSLLQIVERRRLALLEKWKRDSFFQIQVDGVGMLGRALALDVDDAPFANVGRRSQSNVFYVPANGSPDDTASLWVSAAYENYRSAYVAFINTVYRTKFRVADLAGFDADHLLNRANSPKDSTFIRLEAVRDAVNRAWGRLYERFVPMNPREGRKLRWTVASKLAGQMPPSGPDDKAAIERLIQFWVSQGFPRDQVELGITSDLNRIFGRPHGGIVTPTSRWI